MQPNKARNGSHQRTKIVRKHKLEINKLERHKLSVRTQIILVGYKRPMPEESPFTNPRDSTLLCML